MPLNRREFISSTASALVAGCTSVSEPAEIPIIDTHTHFYDPARPQGVPWPEKTDSVLYRTVLPAELKKLAQPPGVRGTVVIEASPWIEDNEWVLELAKTEPFILGVVGHLNPGQSGFSRDLDRFAANHLFRGIRAGGWGLRVSAEKSDYVADLELLARRHLSVDILGGPEDLIKVARLATALPELRIIINHCAGVRIDGHIPDATWTDGIHKVAAQPRVFMKVSGLAEATGKPFPAPTDLEFYRPTLDVLWNAFGEDRLIFGSNWPVSARFADYSSVLAIVRAYFGEKTRAAQKKYFLENAERVYGVRV